MSITLAMLATKFLTRQGLACSTIRAYESPLSVSLPLSAVLPVTSQEI